MQIPLSAAELITIEVMDIKLKKVARKAWNHISNKETFLVTVVMISFLPAHIKHTLVFVSSSIVFAGLMVRFISSVGGMFGESSLIVSMGFAKLTHLGFEMCYEDAYGQPLRLCSSKTV